MHVIYTYSFSGSSSMGPSFSKYWSKAVSMTAGFVHTAQKFSFSVMQDNLAAGILSHDFWLLTFPPSYHGYAVSANAPKFGLKLCKNQCPVIIWKRTMNLD